MFDDPHVFAVVLCARVLNARDGQGPSFISVIRRMLCDKDSETGMEVAFLVRDRGPGKTRIATVTGIVPSGERLALGRCELRFAAGVDIQAGKIPFILVAREFGVYRFEVDLDGRVAGEGSMLVEPARMV